MPPEVPPFPWPLYVATCSGVCVWFALVWLRARARDNWSIVDAAWVFSVPLFAGIPTFASGAPNTRAGVTFILLCVWGVRLGSHLHARVSGGREKEDPRYAEMRERWGARTPAMMFGFYQLQALVVWVLLSPAFIAARDAAPYPRPAEIIGAVIVLAGISGETVSDRQLRDFRADPKNRGRICDTGLRSLSRYPSYFFEWIVWIGFAVAAFPSPGGSFVIAAPALMYGLLVHVTGVKLSDARAKRDKGAAWESYRRRVSTFFPRPPRSGSQP